MIHLREDRDPLEALATDYLARRRRGESPTIAEYAEKYPQWTDEILELFPTIAAMEAWKGTPSASTASPASRDTIDLQRLGDFRLLREIGRGGMGIVYEAEQESLARRVAVKVLPGLLLEESCVERFQREARTAAQLHHTNIVPVFGVGRQDGHHYYVMQLIHGIGLDELLGKLARGTAAERSDLLGVARRELAARWGDRNGSKPTAGGAAPATSEEGRAEASAAGERSDYFQTVARMGLQAAKALDYAHRQGTLHRDIKPANLLLDGRGVVWVADFGLARSTQTDGLSHSGNVAGTLRYMAPERFTGQAAPAGDLYSLGLTLYEFLTFRHAYDDADPTSLIRQVTQEDPPQPRQLNPRIPRDLETIVLKAIAREPAHRYRSAGELAADLERFLEDRPIRARRVGPWERAWRWSRRNRVTAALLGTVAVLLVTVAVVATTGYVRTREALAGVSLERRRAERTSTLALDALDRIFARFSPERVTGSVEWTLTDAEGDRIEIPPQPVLTEDTAALLQELLSFYEPLARQGRNDTAVRQRVAGANRRVGDIRQRLGHFELADEAYARAVALHEQARRDARDDPAMALEIARIRNEQGHIRWLTHQAQEAQRAHQQALALLESAAPPASDAPAIRYEVARTYYLLGRNAPPSPIPGRRRKEASRRKDDRRPARGRPSRRSADPPFAATISEAQKAAYLSRAASGLEQLVHEYPDTPSYRLLFACCRREQSALRASSRGERDAHGNEALRMLQDLVDDAPAEPDYRYELCRTYLQAPLLETADSPQQTAEADACLRTALQLADQLMRDRPDVPDYATAKVHALYRMAELFRRQREAEAVERALREALETQATLRTRFPEASSCQTWTAILQEALAKQLAHRGERHKARQLLESSVETLQRLRAENPANAYLEKLLARSTTTLAAVSAPPADAGAAGAAGASARRREAPP